MADEGKPRSRLQRLVPAARKLAEHRRKIRPADAGRRSRSSGTASS